MNQHFEDRLFFDAVLYVLDEMSPSDRAAFEQRLTEEEVAREALAGAVQFCQTLLRSTLVSPASINFAPAAHGKSRWRRPAIWGAAVAMAAGVLAMALIGPARQEKAPSLDLAEADPGRQLAVAWANLASPAEATDDGEGVDEIAADPLSDEWLDDADVESDASSEREASPTADWLWEALTAS